MGNGTGMSWDLCPGIQIQGLGSGIGTDSLGRLGQISLGYSRDKNLWESQIPSFGKTWNSSPMGFWSPMEPIGISKDLCPTKFRVPKVV